MKKSIFVLLVICGFAFYNCKGQTENEQKKPRFSIFPIKPETPEVQMPKITETPIRSEKSITLRYINGNYYIRRQNREIQIVEDSIEYRPYLGLKEDDSIFIATIIIDEEEIKDFMQARQNRNASVIEKLSKNGMKYLNVKSSKFDKE